MTGLLVTEFCGSTALICGEMEPFTTACVRTKLPYYSNFIGLTFSRYMYTVRVTGK